VLFYFSFVVGYCSCSENSHSWSLPRFRQGQ